MARTQNLVTATEWGVSSTEKSALFSTPGIHTDEELRTVTLNVHRNLDVPNEFGGIGVTERHPEHDGRTFTGPTVDEARDAKDAYCLEHGLLKVYERR